MKIAILSHSTSLFGLQMADQYILHGHEVQFWSLSPVELTHGHEFDVVEITPNYNSLHFRSKLLGYLLSIIPVRRLASSWKPDVIIAIYITSSGVLSGFISHPNIVLSAIGSDINIHISSPIWRLIFKYLFSRAKFIHSVSEDLSNIIINKLKIDEKKILTVPIGVDTNSLVYTSQHMRGQDPIIICTRRHEEVYDHKTLLLAIKELQTNSFKVSVFFIASPGFESTRDAAHELGLSSVSFLPAFKNSELTSVLSRANLYISCSLSDGTSQSLLEAMSVGLFPIVSAISANNYWITNRINGLNFPAGDYVCLARCIIEASGNAKLRHEACEINRKKVVESCEISATTNRIIQSIL